MANESILMKKSRKTGLSTSILYHTLLMMSICYLPFLMSAPWWITALAVITISWRLASDHFNQPLPAFWIRMGLIIGCITLLSVYSNHFFASDFFINTLLCFFWLKVIELQKARDLRLLILISFYVIFSAFILHLTLWILFYLLFALFANITLLIKLEAPLLTYAYLIRKSVLFLAITTPVSLLLFFIFPRLSQPLWQIQWPAQHKTGFSETLAPGSLSTLYEDNSMVMRITFKKPPDSANLYWTGLILNHYNGKTWRLYPDTISNDKALLKLSKKTLADYEILLEPHQKRWLFYLKTPKAAWPGLQFSPDSGLTRLDKKKIHHQFAYALISKTAPYQPLNQKTLQAYLQLPSKVNPKLRAWILKEKKLSQNQTVPLIKRILQHIHQQPFWYTLTPKPLNLEQDPLDTFWFDTQEGYCEHYASTVAFLLRAANIPSRVIVGYYRGEWNPAGQYLTVRQKDAHAWVEYWEPGIGWQRIDPTHAIAKHRISDTLANDAGMRSERFDWSVGYFNLAWWQKANLQLASIRFFWERWLLFYNQEQQHTLLKIFGLSKVDWADLLKLWSASVLGFLLLGGLWIYLRQPMKPDPVLKEYERLQREFKRFHLKTSPPATFKSICDALIQKKPTLKRTIVAYVNHYEQLRLHSSNNNHLQTRKQLKTLFKSLRMILKKESS